MLKWLYNCWSGLWKRARTSLSWSVSATILSALRTLFFNVETFLRGIQSASARSTIDSSILSEIITRSNSLSSFSMVASNVSKSPTTTSFLIPRSHSCWLNPQFVPPIRVFITFLMSSTLVALRSLKYRSNVYYITRVSIGLTRQGPRPNCVVLLLFGIISATKNDELREHSLWDFSFIIHPWTRLPILIIRTSSLCMSRWGRLTSMGSGEYNPSLGATSSQKKLKRIKINMLHQKMVTAAYFLTGGWLIHGCIVYNT